MALIAVAADKGAPGVTTTALALAAVWPRPVLLAECDPAGGDLVYRLPAADGGRLDQRRGLLSLAVAARRGLQPHQAWEHTQKLNGGLDILTGVTNAEQGAGLNLLWGPVGRVLAASSQADVIADCGRLGVDGPLYDLLAEAAVVVLVMRASLGEVVRLRDRSAAVATALHKRGRSGSAVEVVVIAGHKHLRTSIAEIGQALEPVPTPARVGGLADDPKGAELLRGEWGGKLDKSLLIRTARDIAEHLVGRLPAIPAAGLNGGRDGGPNSSPNPGPARGPDGGPATAAAGEPLVSGATWAAAPGPRHAAARGFPPLAKPSGADYPPPDESHAAGRRGVTDAGPPAQPGAALPSAPGAVLPSAPGAVLPSAPGAGLPGAHAAASTGPPAEPGAHAAAPTAPPAQPAQPAQPGESGPGQPGRR
jgi:hypothetical protein